MLMRFRQILWCILVGAAALALAGCTALSGRSSAPFRDFGGPPQEIELPLEPALPDDVEIVALPIEETRQEAPASQTTLPKLGKTAAAKPKKSVPATKPKAAVKEKSASAKTKPKASSVKPSATKSSAAGKSEKKK